MWADLEPQVACALSSGGLAKARMGLPIAPDVTVNQKSAESGRIALLLKELRKLAALKLEK